MSTIHQIIAQRAYDLYVKEGCQHGHCQQYWYQAEQEISQQRTQTHQASQNMQSEGGAMPPSANKRWT